MLTLDTKESRTNPTLRRYLMKHLVDDMEVDDLLSGDCAAIDTPLTMGLEHKSFGDLVHSLTSNRLDAQLAKLVETYDIPILLIDEMPQDRGGKFHLFGARRAVSSAWVLGAILGWSLRGVTPLMVRTPATVGPAVVSAYKLAQKEEHRTAYEPKRLLDNLRQMSLVERILIQFPGIGPDRAAKLKGLTPEQLCKFSVDDWKEALGPLTGTRAWEAWHGKS